MAKAAGVSLRSVQCIWDAHHLRPHRLRTFKRSNDPAFAEKVEDIVGLYMDPPTNIPRCAWLKRHPRRVFLFTPTSASWINAVEGFFSTLIRQRLKRGVPLCQRSQAGHRPLHPRAQRRSKTVRLDQARRSHSRQAQPTA
jgi:hypothetical protein